MENVTDENYIGLICNGEFNSIPNFNIGELFESFFDNINYNVVKEDETVFVDFTGDAMCDDEPCTILIRFQIDKDVEEFEIKEVKVNDEILDEDEIIDLLEDIAYVGGAVVEDDSCSSCSDGDCSCCSKCSHEDEENDKDGKNKKEDNK